MARRFQEHKAEDIAANVGDRFAHRNGEVRSHIDELQRRNIEELRELHRYYPLPLLPLIVSLYIDKRLLVILMIFVDSVDHI